MINVSWRNPHCGISRVSGFGVNDSGLFIPRVERWSFLTQLPIIPHYLNPTQLNQLTPTSFYLYTRFIMSASTNSSSSYITAPTAPPSSYFGDDESYGPIPPRDMGLFGDVPITGVSSFPRGPVCPTIPEVGEYLAGGPDASIGPLLPERNHDGRMVWEES